MNKYGVLFLIAMMWLTACTDLAEPNAVENSSVTAYPSPEASPTPTSSIGESLAPVASGQGVEEAAVFNPDKDAPYHFLILDTCGEIHPWNDQLPSTWKPEQVSDTELVIVIREELDTINAQKYSDGGKMTRYRRVVTATIREAHTGSIVAENSFIGAAPGPFPKTRISRTKLVGPQIDFQYLYDWLNTEAAQLLEKYQPPVHVFNNHGQRVLVVAFSYDGKFMATGNYGGDIFLWRVEDGVLLYEIDAYGSRRSVTALAFSPDGRQLASGSDLGGILKIWGVSTGDLIATDDNDWFNNNAEFTQIIFSPDSQFIFGELGVCLTEVRGSDLEPLTPIFGSRVVLSKDGMTLFSGCRVAFSKDGMTLFVYDDGTMDTYQINGGEVSHISEVEFSFRLNPPVFSPEMDMMASRTGGEIILYRISDGQNLRTLGPLSQDNVRVAFSPDGLLLAAGFPENSVSIWRVSDGEILTTLTGHLREVRSIAFSPDGKFLASASYDGTVRMWSLEEILEE